MTLHAALVTVAASIFATAVSIPLTVIIVFGLFPWPDTEDLYAPSEQTIYETGGHVEMCTGRLILGQ